ncbi:unnamed protein product [uncultured bacterium]|nr:unnamed protein product [uncultured bacterium]
MSPLKLLSIRFAAFSKSDDPAFATDESQSARGRNSSRTIIPSLTV